MLSIESILDLPQGQDFFIQQDDKSDIYLYTIDGGVAKLYKTSSLNGTWTALDVTSLEFNTFEKDLVGLRGASLEDTSVLVFKHAGSMSILKMPQVEARYEYDNVYRLYWAVDSEKLYMNICDSWEMVGTLRHDLMHNIGTLTHDELEAKLDELEQAIANAAVNAGMPTGGTTGQVLVKKSNTDADVEWKSPDTSAAKALPLDVAPVGASKFYDDFSAATLNSNWAWVNQGSATYSLTDVPDFLKVTKPTEGINLRAIMQNKPVCDFTITAKLATDSCTSEEYAGVILLDSASGHHDMIGFRLSGTTVPTAGQTGYTSLNGAGAHDYVMFNATQLYVWVKIVIVGTTASCYYSTNGLWWPATPNKVITVPPAFDKIGIGANAGFSSNPGFSIYCDWFRVI